MASGLLRIEENVPTENRKPQLSKEQKWASLCERIFMEAIGVPFHVLTLYFLQEPVSKLFERSPFLKPPKVTGLLGEAKVHQKAINTILRRAYAPNLASIPHGIVAKQIYNRADLVQKVANVRSLIAEKLGSAFTPQVKAAVNASLMNYQRRLWVAAAATIGVGVVGAAWLSGYVLQLLNDTLVSKKVIPAILDWCGLSSGKKPKTEAFIPGPPPSEMQDKTFRM
jgi:hypothetical protein